MGKIKLIIILIVIFVFCTASYFFIVKFSNPKNASKYSSPPLIQISSSNSAQTTQCSSDQLAATIAAQGAAGNVYASLALTNKGKSACTVELGNTIIGKTDAKNVTIHYQKIAPLETFVLAPSKKVYSQIHYPNGPQCQNGISPKPITFSYKTDQTAIPFQSTTPHMAALVVQACRALSEQTTIHIWPLSKSPTTQ